MKKLILFITVLFFNFSLVQAQDEASYGFAQGDWVLGGGISFNNSDDGTDEMKSSEIMPEVMYFINDNWALGAGVGLLSMDDGTDKVSNTVIAVEARNYFLDMGERTKWYFNVGFGNASGDSFDDSLTSLGVGLGMNYFMNENIIIDFGLADLLSYAKSGDVSAMSLGWTGEIENIRQAATLSIIFKL
tara:strand:+ start:1384 stop:1947 length:564 start_codon:yes stop_codon:yes gene_type:complete